MLRSRERRRWMDAGVGGGTGGERVDQDRTDDSKRGSLNSISRSEYDGLRCFARRDFASVRGHNLDLARPFASLFSVEICRIHYVFLSLFGLLQDQNL